MILTQWAARHGIPYEAVRELLGLLGVQDIATANSGESEAAVQSRVRLEAAKKGLGLWRNNVGGASLPDGSFLRYGLANDTKALNERFKSSDLIGIRPVYITTAHVGHTLGQFVARECKTANWRFTGTAREMAQLAFIEFVISKGGDAGFCTGEGTL